MAFPIQRLRRLRSSEALRRLVRETQLAPSQFIFPLFVVPGQGIRKEILPCRATRKCPSIKSCSNAGNARNWAWAV